MRRNEAMLRTGEGRGEETRAAVSECFWAVALIGACLAIGYGAMAMISERALMLASLQ